MYIFYRTMYYDSKPVMTPGPKTPTGKQNYEENLQTIGTFDTVTKMTIKLL
jgi:hypothetical protein